MHLAYDSSVKYLFLLKMDSNRQQTRGNFSPDGKLFAVIDIDGKLSIWDTETSELKQQYTPNVFLNTGCTSLIWVNVGASSPRKVIFFICF